MGSELSFFDREFGHHDYDPDDQGSFIGGLVSVSMPFKGKKWDDVYKTIQAECRKHGLIAQRVDEYVASGIVLKDIAKLIEDAEFLIFDLSLEKQNVYYELGYAHGIGNMAEDILLIAEEGTRLHYDVAGLRVHYYSSILHLSDILAKGLSDMIRRRG